MVAGALCRQKKIPTACAFFSDIDLHAAYFFNLNQQSTANIYDPGFAV
jgi:hypothetical protein